MRNFSLGSSFNVLFNAAIITSDVVFEKGFLARDVQFYIELYANWMELAATRKSLNVQIVQVQRYMQALQNEKQLIATTTRANGRKRFRLNTEGRFSVLEQLAEPNEIYSFETVLFVRYIVRSYRKFILERIEKSAKLSQAQRDRLEELLETKRVVSGQKVRYKNVLNALKTRIDECEAMSNFAVEASKTKATRQIVKEVGEKFRFQLSYRKPFADLYSEFQEPLQIYELTHGLRERNVEFFEVLRDLYSAQLKILESLK